MPVQAEFVSVMAGKGFSEADLRVSWSTWGKEFLSSSLSGQLCSVMGILKEMCGCACLFMLCWRSCYCFCWWIISF